MRKKNTFSAKYSLVVSLFDEHCFILCVILSQVCDLF